MTLWIALALVALIALLVVGYFSRPWVLDKLSERMRPDSYWMDHPNESFHPDLALEHIRDDLLNRDRFARYLARSITRMRAPEGLVVAIAGEWGSGKSTLLNFVTEELEDAVNAPKIIRFNPWWFTGRDGLANAFIFEVRKTLGGTPLLRFRLRRFGAVAAKAVKTLRRPGRGANVAGAISEFLEGDVSLQKSKARLARSMRRRKQETVIVIDDIDRLEPEEAAVLFGVVKALGDFPNTVYLVGCDVDLIGRQLDAHFGSGGAEYLSKIIQVKFPVPLPTAEALQAVVGPAIDDIIGEPRTELFDELDWNDAFTQFVMPRFGNLRDVYRFLNSLSVTYPAVEGEVNVVDFVLLELTRVFEPEIYTAMLTQVEIFTAVSSSVTQADGAAHLERKEILMRLTSGDRTPAQRDRLRKMLVRMFHMTDDALDVSTTAPIDPHKRRMLCDNLSLPTYFSFDLYRAGVSKEELDSVVSVLGSFEKFGKMLERAEAEEVLPGINRGGLLLHEIRTHVDLVDPDDVPNALSVLIFRADDRVDYNETLRTFPLPLHLALIGTFTDLLRRAPSAHRRDASASAIDGSHAPVFAAQLVRHLCIESRLPEEFETAREAEANGVVQLGGGFFSVRDLAILEDVTASLIEYESTEPGFIDKQGLESALWSWMKWRPENCQHWMTYAVNDPAMFETLLWKFQTRYATDGRFENRGNFSAFVPFKIDEEIVLALEKHWTNAGDGLFQLIAQYLSTAPDGAISEDTRNRALSVVNSAARGVALHHSARNFSASTSGGLAE